MLPPEKSPLGDYQLTATYLDRKTGATFPLIVPEIEVQQTIKDIFEPEAISKLQQLSKLFAQGKIDAVFSQLNTLNQYDPTQDYLNQAQQALKYRIKADLTDARMHHADLTRTILCYSTMINVESIDAHLAKTDLEGANLINANLMRAEMSSASTIGTILTGAKIPDGRMYANV